MGAPADNDGVAVTADGGDNLGQVIEVLVRPQVFAFKKRGDPGVTAAHFLFIEGFNDLFADIGTFRHVFDDLVVHHVHLQRRGKPLSNFRAAGARLPGNRDHRPAGPTFKLLFGKILHPAQLMFDITFDAGSSLFILLFALFFSFQGKIAGVFVAIDISHHIRTDAVTLLAFLPPGTDGAVFCFSCHDHFLLEFDFFSFRTSKPVRISRSSSVMVACLLR
ncbi:MAG: hypothetical protein A4E72_01197 [Syntrophus sp. PtaU1.Bin208]|nr:MAG: hypothetical protein A4E72_01197 [Syntrophus sp. PtaU1.Bin208]